MSEFLGTLLIVLVLWFGGLLILGDGTSMEASTFIFYMVILYSIINPLKTLQRQDTTFQRVWHPWNVWTKY